MSGTRILIESVGSVALLLWGMHMVQSGVTRAYGANLRHLLGGALGNRFTALLAGLGVTTVLQSSTATALIATSFVSMGAVDLVPALALMLGANVGTTLIVQTLAFDVSWLSAILFFGGLLAFRRGTKTAARDLGRVAIGLGLMLHAVHLLVVTIDQAEGATVMRELFASASTEPILALTLTAVLAWASHSSVAVILVIMSLAEAQIVSPLGAVPLVLGANLGGALVPLLESGAAATRESRRLPLGNLLTRLAGCALVLPFQAQVADWLTPLQSSPARFVANFHTLLNVALAVLFIGVLDGLAKLLTRLIPSQAATASPGQARYLDLTVLQNPAVAMSNAAREALRMADVVERMLRGVQDALATNDRKLVAEIGRMDDTLDELHEAIKLYLARIDLNELDEAERARYWEIVALTINLEHVGDIIDKNLRELASKKIKHQLQFSTEGLEEIHRMLARLMDNLRLSLAVFLSGDVDSAMRLVEEKEAFRQLERSGARQHFARLREGVRESVETSSLHIDIMRDARRINSHLVAVVYPILDKTDRSSA
jgi:phosphate:Na+ symporter